LVKRSGELRRVLFGMLFSISRMTTFAPKSCTHKTICVVNVSAPYVGDVQSRGEERVHFAESHGVRKAFSDLIQIKIKISMCYMAFGRRHIEVRDPL